MGDREQGLMGRKTERSLRLWPSSSIKIGPRWSGLGCVHPVWGELPAELLSILFSLLGTTGAQVIITIGVCNFLLFKDS